MFRNLRIAFFLGFKSIVRGNKATIFLMVFIMSLAFINLVFISSILSGILSTIDNQVKTNFVSNIVVEPEEGKELITNVESLQQQIEKIPSVIVTAIHYQLTGTIGFDKEKNGNFVYQPSGIVGINPENEKNISEISQRILDGEYLENPGEGEIILGADLAGGYKEIDDPNSLAGAKVGDPLKITFGNGKTKDYKVKGIYQSKFAFVDAMAFVTAKEAESILSVENNASQILVKTDKPEDEDQIISQIQKLAPNLKVRKWTEYIGVVGDLSTSLNMIVVIISIIGLIVAAITIFILIYVNTVHKRRQIGILKAIGIKKNIIINSYIFQALFYALSGVIVGSLIIFYVLDPYFANHPLELPVGETSLALNSTRVIYNIISLIAAALVGGLISSWQGVKTKILKAIWGN